MRAESGRVSPELSELKDLIKALVVFEPRLEPLCTKLVASTSAPRAQKIRKKSVGMGPRINNPSKIARKEKEKEKKSTTEARLSSDQYTADQFRSSMTEEQVSQLLKNYRLVPEFYCCRAPGADKRPSRPKEGEVAVYLKAFEFGLRQPLQPFFYEFLTTTSIALAQLSSNNWITLSDCYTLWREHLERDPRYDELFFLHSLNVNANNTGWYNLSPGMGPA